MTDFPDVTIQVMTYKRPKAIRKCLAALFSHLHYQGDLHLHINDDCTGDDYLTDLNKWLGKRSPYPFTLQSTACNSGLGINTNTGLQTIATDYIFSLQDDYELREHMDITPGVALLQAHDGIGLVRYSGILGHELTCTIIEHDIDMPEYKQGHMFVPPGRCNYFDISPHSKGLYIYSDRPHLKHARWHNYYGDYPIGITPGLTEETFSHRVKQLMKNAGAPKVAVLPEYIIDPFGVIPVDESFNTKAV